MKNFKFWSLLWVIVIFGTLAGCWNKNDVENVNENENWDFVIEDISTENNAAIDYNDNLVDLASACIMSEESIWDTYSDESASVETVTLAINKTVDECSSAMDAIEELGDFEWDSSLKDWVLNIIGKDIAYYSKFNEILPYIAKEQLTEEENTTYEGLLAEIDVLDKELTEANTNLITIQEQFAKNHGYELESAESGSGVEE